MANLYTSGLKCQNYTQVVKNVKSIHKWLKMSKKNTQVVKNVKIIHKWLKMAKLYTSS